MNKEYLFGVAGVAIGALGMWLFFAQSPDKQMGMSMDAMTAELTNKSGDEFDQAFLSLMIEHHEGALDMARLIPSRAKHDELKRLGEDIVSAQTREIDMMHEWSNAWGYGHTMSDMKH